jgi:hypothetical protein
MLHGKKLLLLLAFVTLLALPGSAGVRLGGVIVGAGYSHFSGSYCCYSPYYYDAFDGYYGPFGYGPWNYPFWYTQPGPNKGTVKLDKVEKTAQIYIDQAFAGVAKDLKTIYLDPGAYDLEVRPLGKEPVQKRVYVLSGKTVKLEF